LTKPMGDAPSQRARTGLAQPEPELDATPPRATELIRETIEPTAPKAPLRDAVQKLFQRGPVRPAKAIKSTRYAQLSPEDVVYIHEELVEDFASSADPIEPPGLRDANLLASALSRQSASFAGHEKYKTIDGRAASMFYGICQNHAFHNGNKRTAVVSLLCYLDRNGFQLEASQDELYKLVTSMAAHKLLSDARPASDDEVDFVRKWIGERIRQISKGERPLRFRDFRSILVAFGCTVDPPSKGFIMLRRTLGRHSLRRKLPYHGETKEVEPGYIGVARKALQLDEQHGFDSEVFYGARLEPDAFITKYRVLLRRLAHV
jgi:death-on-curing family protein